MDISFLTYSLKICQQNNDFVIDPVKEFVNLGVKDTEIQSQQVLRTIQRSELEENKDYSELSHVAELRKQGGTSTKKSYLLTPDAFKIILLDINNHKQRIKFTKYFVLFEKCVAYYNDQCVVYLI